MKKLLIPAAAVLAVALAGGGWFLYGRSGNPIDNARAMSARGDLRGAQIELRNAVRANPGNAEAHFLLAEAQLLSGDALAAEKEAKAARDLGYDAARTSVVIGGAYVAQARWREVLAEVPETAPTPDMTGKLLVLRGVAQWGLQDVAAAKAALAEAGRVAPGNADAPLMLGRIAFVERDGALAERKADEALAIDPKRSDAHALKAQVALQRNDTEAALAALDRAVDTSPTLSVYRMERASLLIGLGRDAKARTDVDAVLAREPGNAGAMYASMVLLVRAGKFAEAEPLAQRLGPVADRFPRMTYFDAMIKGSLGQWEQAVALATRYVARVPNDPDGVRLLARVQIGNRQAGAAVATLTRAVSAGQGDAETLDLLGRAYALDGKPVQATAQFQRASALAPQNPGILTRLASTQMQAGDVSSAQNALERSLAIQPNQANAGEALVAAALAVGDLDRAQAALGALRAAVGETEAVGVLDARIKIGRLEFEAARQQFAAVVEKTPTSQEGRLGLAKVLMLLGRPAEAVAVWKAMLAKEPGNVQAMVVLVPQLLQENKGAEALAVVESVRAAQPDNKGLAAYESDLLIRLGQGPRAVALLEGLRLDGTLPLELDMALSRAKVAASSPEEAKAIVARLVAANPRNMGIRAAQINLLGTLNDGPALKAALQDALKQTPGDLPLMQTLIGVEGRLNGQDAAIALTDQLRKDPANMPAAAFLKGDLMASLQRFPEAVAAFEAELKAAPSTALVLRAANARAAGGAPDRGLQQLKEWLAQHPGDPDVAQGLAALQIQVRQLPEAEKNLEAVLEKRPNDVIALNNLAWLYQQRNDPRALVTAQRAFIQTQSPETSDTLGWILVTQGQAAQGLQLLRAAGAQRPTDKTVWFHIATALKDTGQTEDAVKLLQALLADPREFPDKAAAQEMLKTLAPGR